MATTTDATITKLNSYLTTNQPSEINVVRNGVYSTIDSNLFDNKGKIKKFYLKLKCLPGFVKKKKVNQIKIECLPTIKDGGKS